MPLDNCDQCRFSTPGGFYCGKGLKIRDPDIVMPRKEIYDCSGYEQGTQARSYKDRVDVRYVPFQASLYDPALASYMRWIIDNRVEQSSSRIVRWEMPPPMELPEHDLNDPVYGESLLANPVLVSRWLETRQHDSKNHDE